MGTRFSFVLQGVDPAVVNVLARMLAPANVPPFQRVKYMQENPFIRNCFEETQRLLKSFGWDDGSGYTDNPVIVIHILHAQGLLSIQDLACAFERIPAGEFLEYELWPGVRVADLPPLSWQ